MGSNTSTLSNMDDRSTKTVEQTLRAALHTIRRCWTYNDQPSDAPHRGSPRSIIPGGVPTQVRTACVQDLRFWVAAAVDAGIGEPPDWVARETDQDDVPRLCGRPPGEVRDLSEWDSVARFESEMVEHAWALRQLTVPPTRLVHIGVCPVQVPALAGDGHREGSRDCGAVVAADPKRPEKVRCKGCGTVDTVEGWQRRMVGKAWPERASALGVRLRRIGITANPALIRKWASRQEIPAHVGVDAEGFSLYDPAAVVAALINRERRRLNG